MSISESFDNKVETVVVKFGKCLADYVNLNKLSEKINEECDKNDAEEFAIMISEIIIHNSILAMLLIIISHLLGIKVLTAAYVLTYIPLRRCFGGAHASNNLTCLIISIAGPVSVSIISKHLVINILLLAAAYVFAYFTATKIGVVDNPKKRLKQERKVSLKRQGVVTLSIILCLNYFLYVNGSTAISNTIILTIVLFFTNLYLGK